MRDAKEIIEDMKNIVKPGIMEYLRKINCEGMGENDATEFSEEFDYILQLAQKGADLAAGDKFQNDLNEEPKREIFWDARKNSYRSRSTEFDIIIECNSKKEFEKTSHILEHLHERPTREAINLMIDNIKQLNPNSFPGDASMAAESMKNVILTIIEKDCSVKIFEEGKEHDNTESDSGDRNI